MSTGSERSSREAEDWHYVQERIERAEARSIAAEEQARVMNEETRDTLGAIRELLADAEVASLPEKSGDVGTDLLVLRSARNQAQAAVAAQPRAPQRLMARMDSATRVALITAAGVIISAVVAAGGSLAAGLFGPDTPSPVPYNNIYANPSPYTGSQYPYPPYSPFPPQQQLPPSGTSGSIDCLTEAQKAIEMIRLNPDATITYNGQLEAQCHLNEIVRQQKSLPGGSSQTTSVNPPQPGG